MTLRPLSGCRPQDPSWPAQCETEDPLGRPPALPEAPARRQRRLSPEGELLPLSAQHQDRVVRCMTQDPARRWRPLRHKQRLALDRAYAQRLGSKHFVCRISNVPGARHARRPQDSLSTWECRCAAEWRSHSTRLTCVFGEGERPHIFCTLHVFLRIRTFVVSEFYCSRSDSPSQRYGCAIQLTSDRQVLTQELARPVVDRVLLKLRSAARRSRHHLPPA